MTDFAENPYTEFGTLAVGERFVGRHDDVTLLTSVVAGGKASRAIVGLPRVGKSSLAKTVWTAASVLEGVDALWIDVSSVATDRTLSEAIQRDLAHLDGNEQVLGDSAYERLKEMLTARRRNGRRVVVVFDEFDSVRFTANVPLSVRRLRELVIDPARYALTAVLVCRRELETLEEQIADLSNLANACPTINLKTFTNAELDELIARGFSMGLPAATVDVVRHVTGNYPGLAEQALMLLHGGAPRETMLDLMRLPMQQVFGQVAELLTYAGLWNDLVEIAKNGSSRFGIERERLSGYGVIASAGGTSYITSDALRRYIIDSGPPLSVWSTDARQA